MKEKSRKLQKARRTFRPMKVWYVKAARGKLQWGSKKVSASQMGRPYAKVSHPE